jgi:quinol monooxygenase YgiN
MHRYGLCGKLAAVSGKRDRVTSIMKRASESVAKLEGCLLYIVFEDLQDKDALWITEIWTSKAAHDMSLQNESVKAAIAEAMPCLNTVAMSRAELLPLFGVGMPA